MKLSLLQFVASEYPDTNLGDTAVIACQHILPTTFELFEELFEKGLKPKNVFLIGKCYSTNRETMKRFKSAGVNIADDSLSFNSSSSFDEQFQSYIENFFRKILSIIDIESYTKVVILDDGGHLIAHANDFLKDFNKCAAVEQTASGYEKIKSIKLNFPVINVALSRAKLEVESPFIAETIFQKIKGYLHQYNIIDPNILIVGSGNIGTAISALLKKKYKVSCCDIIKQKCDFGGDYKSHLNEFDLIIGATGTCAIQPGDFGLLKQNVLLVSASSSDREFSAVYLRQQLASKIRNCHEDIKVDGIILLNCGFPVNFNNGQENESRKDIQFTRSLLLMALLEATTKTFLTKIVDLNLSLQEKLIQEFMSLKN